MNIEGNCMLHPFIPYVLSQNTSSISIYLIFNHLGTYVPIGSPIPAWDL